MQDKETDTTQNALYDLAFMPDSAETQDGFAWGEQTRHLAADDIIFQDTETDRQAAAIEALATDLKYILHGNLSEEAYGKAQQELIRMFQEAEEHVLRSLSLYLCELDNVPEKIIGYLAKNSFRVAQPILEKSSCVDESLMHQIIHMKAADFWRVLAKRYDLTDSVIESLAACQDYLTALHLLENDRIIISEKAFGHCYTLSRQHQNLAAPMAQRAEIPKQIALQIYWHVSQSLRSRLQQIHLIPDKQLAAAFKSALADFHDGMGESGEFAPTSLMWELAFKYQQQNKITPAIMVKTLHDRRTRFFIAMLSTVTGIHYTILYKAIGQSGGRMFALICKAHGFGKEQFVSAFLKARGSIYAAKVVHSDELHRAINVFDSVSADKARTIIHGADFH